MPRRRIDTLLAERGLFDSRSRAAAAVLAGEVRLHDGRRAEKPGQLVPEDEPLEVEDAPRYVSRGGLKLENALGAFALDPQGRRCLDLGAATGGFTDCLLQHGAAAVVALDVAYGELHWRLRHDPRVTVVERRNARSLARDHLPWPPELVVADLSFISLKKVLPVVPEVAAARFDCLALVKPQFEVGRGEVGKGGVVRSADARRETLVEVGRFAAEELGMSVLGYASSGLPGPAGNLESFIRLAEAGREGAAQELESAARRAEP